jgi:predicted metalloprotease with PDZ domain
MRQISTHRLTMFFILVFVCTTLTGQEAPLPKYKNDYVRERHFKSHQEPNNGERITYKKVKHGFLGIRENFDVEKQEGVVLIVGGESRAAKAGLQTGDVLLQLNNTPINDYHDVTVFMRKSKPNEVIQIKYQREGLVKTTSATLEERENVWHTEVEKEEKVACLGVLSNSFNKEGGAKITEFMEVSAAVEAKMQVGDVITGINGIGVKNFDALWQEIAKYQPKEKVSVQYTRNGEPLRLYATLKACNPKSESTITLSEAQKDAAKININAEQRQLSLENFGASPNPIRNVVNIQFEAEAVPTTVALYDATGKTLYQQTFNDFSGSYSQCFDVSAYAKGFVVVQITQEGKTFSKKLIIN